MCHVSNFLCGCADLRRGALIIGITKLVISCSIIAIFAIYLIVEGATASGGDCQVESLTHMFELSLLP